MEERMNIKRITTTVFAVIVLAMSAFGADRALVIGIDHYKYNTIVGDTPGSVADAEAMAIFIREKYKFPKEAVHILRESEATAANIKSEIQTWLINGSKPGDRIFFFYSGHGGQIDDDNGDEKDQLDEALAPFDVHPGDRNAQPSNVIRDDEMNLFLLQLSGRRVVMAFDSCNSGTISRSIEPKSKFVALKNKHTPLEATRSMTDQESYIPKDARNKDMSVVKEEFVDGKLNGIVIFSAAAPYQKAMWLKDQSRGAFAYSFEMVQKNDDKFPTVGELDRRIKEYMEYLKKEKLVVTAQVPESEIISETPLEDKPLFGENPTLTGAAANWEAAVLPALHNPLANYKVKINIGKNTFGVGDVIDYSVTLQGLKADDKAYLYILDFARDDNGDKYVVSLFPTKAGNDSDNKLGNGTHAFPRQGQDGREYNTVAETKGKDIFVALVTKTKLNLVCDENDKCGSWEEVYKKIGLNDLQSQINKVTESTRSFGNRPKLEGGDWQASSVVVFVK